MISAKAVAINSVVVFNIMLLGVVSSVRHECRQVIDAENAT